MIRSSIVLCFAFLYCSALTNAQQLVKTEEGYLLNKTEHKTSTEILNLLENHPIAYKYYQDARRDGGVANVLGVLSLISIGATGFFLFKTPSTNGNSPNYGYLTLGAGSLSLACLTGTVGIVFLNKSYRKKKEVVDHFNASILGQGPVNRYFKLRLENLNNGLGLVLSF